MYAIKETAEMIKFQKQARVAYEAGCIDVDAVNLGWKLGPGRWDNNTIVSPDRSKKMKITGSHDGDRLYDVHITVGDKSADEKWPAHKIGALILKLGWTVGNDELK